MDASFTHPTNEHKPTPGVPVSALPIKITSEWVALGKIHESPFNPRKDFDAEGIAELAASIAQRGLQQNLVVRVHPKKAGHYELMAGHRRLKALQLNKASGCLCNVIAADDGEARAHLIVENLQRQDLGPLEEAEAFDQLNKSDPKRWTTDAIATAIGKTQRFVQQRLALIRNLAPETAKVMKSGKLHVESARVLAAAPHSLQERVIDRHKRNLTNLSADDAREALAQYAVPKSAAAFDVTLYKGAWIEEGKSPMFADVAEFNKLQKGAAKVRLEKLKKDWPNAELIADSATGNWVWVDNGSSLAWNRTDGGKAEGKHDPKKVTAVVWIDRQHKIRVAEGVKPKPKKKSPSYSHTPTPRYNETPERKIVREDFNARIGAAYAKDSGVPLRFLLLEVAGGCDGLNIEPARVKRALPGIPVSGRWLTDEEKAKLWPKIAALKDAAVVKALTEIARGIVDVDNDYSDFAWSDHQKECPKLLAAIGASLGIKQIAEPKPAPAPAAKTAGAHEKKVKAKPKAAAKKAAKAKKHQ